MATVLITPRSARRVTFSDDVPTADDLRGDYRIGSFTTRRRPRETSAREIRPRDALDLPKARGINRGSATSFAVVSLATALASATSIPANRAVIEAGVLSSGAVIALALLSCRGLGTQGQYAARTHLVCALLCAIPLAVGVALDNADLMIGNMMLSAMIWTAALRC